MSAEAYDRGIGGGFVPEARALVGALVDGATVAVRGLRILVETPRFGVPRAPEISETSTVTQQPHTLRGGIMYAARKGSSADTAAIRSARATAAALNALIDAAAREEMPKP